MINKYLEKRVSPQELKSSLKISLEKNIEAIDYVQNELNRLENLYNYNETVELKKDIEILEYLMLILKFTGDRYSEQLIKLKHI